MGTWPEEEWERLAPYVDVDVMLAEQLLGEPVKRVTLLTGGKANTNYRIDLRDGPVVLRIYERDAASRERERNLFELVGDVVPVPRWLDDGATADWPYAVISWVEGVHPHVVLEPESAEVLGRALGAGLRAIERVEPPGARATIGLLDAELGFARTFESVAESFVDLLRWSLSEGRARKRLGPELSKVLGAAVDRAARRLEPLDEWRGLAHGDYKLSNLLVADGALVAVLDWEFACAFTPMLDIAIMMRHRDEFPPGFVAGFEIGHGGLHDEWGDLSRIMDLMNLVGFLNAAGDRPHLFDAVRERIELTIPLI